MLLLMQHYNMGIATYIICNNLYAGDSGDFDDDTSGDGIVMPVK